MTPGCICYFKRGRSGTWEKGRWWAWGNEDGQPVAIVEDSEFNFYTALIHNFRLEKMK